MQPKPPSILDPKFKYVPAASTDIRKTFERARQALAKKPSPKFNLVQK